MFFDQYCPSLLMYKVVRFLVIGFGILLLAGSCKKEKPKDEKPQRTVAVPAFNADSAFQFVRQQVEFGPRVPNTETHRKAAGYLISRLKNSGASVIEQNFEATSYDNQKLKLKNIIASFAPEKQKRLLLAAHWDTRPFADKDEEKKDAPFDGANDGASGVGILLEIARQLQSAPNAPDVGVDIILFDGEDWGEKDHDQKEYDLPEGLLSWWCLGSQYWARHKHKANYSANYAILLDMVGAKRAHFYREGLSLEFAPRVVEKVWNTAERIGYSDFFVKQNVGEITDDHQFMNRIAKIPTVDIVDYRPGVGFFGDYHHSTKDNLELISKETLKAVGQTLMTIIYDEEAL